MEKEFLHAEHMKEFVKKLRKKSKGEDKLMCLELLRLIELSRRVCDPGSWNDSDNGLWELEEFLL